MTPVATGAGSVRRLPTELVERRLGPTAAHVLRMLWTWRDPAGVVTVSRERLAAQTRGFAPVSVRAVRKALARLAEAGLVENLGWRPVTCGIERIFVFARRVYGEETRGNRLRDGFFFVMPEPAGRWIRSRTTDATRGGGQGRGGAPLENRNAGGDGSSSANSGRFQGRRYQRAKTLLAAVRRGDIKVNSPENRLESDEAKRRARIKKDPPQWMGPTPTMDGAAFGSYLREVSSSSLREEEAPRGGAVFLSVRTEPEVVRSADPEGLRLGGRPPSRRRQLAAHGAPVPNLPRFPTLRSAAIPHPPRLRPDVEIDEAAHELAHAYRSAYEATTGQRCWAAQAGSVTRSKNWPTLLAAADFMRAADMAPAAWVAWSFDMWAKKTPRPPPLSWVFSVRRLGDRYDWFRHEGYDTLGGTIVAGAKERALFRRYALLLAAIDREYAIDAAPLVARFFPEGFAQAVRAVECEIGQVEADLARRLASGAWLWGTVKNV